MTGTPFEVGDRITLKKKHPCGGSDWEVYRIGADIGMKCLTCERRMMLSRRDAERRTVNRIAVDEKSEEGELSSSPESSG
jgi:hypothetical protein